jgi:hypothetical protein
MNTYQKVSNRVMKMDLNTLETIWESLKTIKYFEKDIYEGNMTMGEWVEMIYSEISYRKMDQKGA